MTKERICRIGAEGCEGNIDHLHHLSKVCLNPACRREARRRSDEKHNKIRNKNTKSASIKPPKGYNGWNCQRCGKGLTGYRRFNCVPCESALNALVSRSDGNYVYDIPVTIGIRERVSTHRDL
jgi:hypothetical protein